MPLLDHFRPPVSSFVPWESFHSAWATYLASHLNDHWLPSEYHAVERTRLGGGLEVDVGTLDTMQVRMEPMTNGPALATLPRTYVPPAPAGTVSAVFPENFEVRIIGGPAGSSLVAAIELVSPGNKDRPEERRAFATKCASYLHEGIALVIIDVVTTRRANMHDDILALLQLDANTPRPDSPLYAVSYRPVRRGDREEIDIWTASCSVGAALPTMPLRLSGDLFVPVEFETTYQETCRRRRLS